MISMNRIFVSEPDKPPDVSLFHVVPSHPSVDIIPKTLSHPVAPPIRSSYLKGDYLHLLEPAHAYLPLGNNF
jgi:hypothetical protein